MNTESHSAGHRQRLRERFLVGDEQSRGEEALLELLLTYAIPQRDTRSLAAHLIARFGSLDQVLAVNAEMLCAVDGISEHSAVLIKLVDCIRDHHPTHQTPQSGSTGTSPCQPALFDLREEDVPAPASPTMAEPLDEKGGPARRRVQTPRSGTGLFGKAVLEEAIKLLPQLPETESVGDVRAFLRTHLHYSAAETRVRNANYIVERMFPNGYVDRPMRTYSRQYDGQQELRDVCYYRFCRAEPLMFEAIDNLVLPGIGYGQLARSRLSSYLTGRFPTSKSVEYCSRAIVGALVAAGLAKSDRRTVTFAYRDVLIPSFAFVVHSEFPDPGMFDISELEGNRAVRAMLWSPERILPALYELRNRGFIATVSEIDNVRQFTTTLTLDEVVRRLAEGRNHR